MSHLAASSQPDLDLETSVLLDYMHNENLPLFITGLIFLLDLGTRKMLDSNGPDFDSLIMSDSSKLCMVLSIHGLVRWSRGCRE